MAEIKCRSRGILDTLDVTDEKYYVWISKTDWRKKFIKSKTNSTCKFTGYFLYNFYWKSEISNANTLKSFFFSNKKQVN